MLPTPDAVPAVMAVSAVLDPLESEVLAVGLVDEVPDVESVPEPEPLPAVPPAVASEIVVPESDELELVEQVDVVSEVAGSPVKVDMMGISSAAVMTAGATIFATRRLRRDRRCFGPFCRPA